MQLFDDDFADRFDFDVLDATKIIPEEQVPVRRVGPAGARPHASTTSSPRPSRSRSARRTSCPASTSPTTRCCRAATSPTSTPSSSGSAARTSPTCPINAPKCPVAHFQQDGHMAMRQPRRAGSNYEPNSWTGEAGGPARGPRRAASRPSRQPVEGAKRRVRSETFADHYSQARQFYVSQTPDRAGPHRRRVRLRAEQGASSPASARAWSPTCATSTRTSPPRWPTGSRLDAAAGRRRRRPGRRSRTCRRRRR